MKKIQVLSCRLPVPETIPLVLEKFPGKRLACQEVGTVPRRQGPCRTEHQEEGIIKSRVKFPVSILYLGGRSCQQLTVSGRECQEGERAG